MPRLPYVAIVGSMALLLLAACVPVTYAPNTSFVFSASYDELFDATLQALTTSYVARPTAGRYAFVVTSADRDSGLITAERLSSSAGGVIVTQRFSKSDGPFRFRLSLPLSRAPSEHTLLSVVVQGVDANHTSLAYSSTPATTSKANAFYLYIRGVIAELETQFAQTTLQPQ